MTAFDRPQGAIGSGAATYGSATSHLGRVVISASVSSLFRMRLLRPAGGFVGRDANARWGRQEAEMWAFRQNEILQ
jgi:hypothetical protein